MGEKIATREEIKALCSLKPTDPDALKWKPLFGTFKNTLRLRMNITEENASMPLLDACRTYIYPAKDPPEVQGLLKVLDKACYSANLSYHLTKGPKELQKGGVSFFEPYKIDLPFRKAKLSLVIAPGEFQWILENVKKEKDPMKEKVEILKQQLLKETKEWVRRGNR